MITKAIVTQLVPPNKFKVRIPIFDGFSGQQGAVSDEHLSNATLCTLPNSDNVINVGDIVYVAFEDNDAGRPVILGHLYTGTSKTNTIIDLSKQNYRLIEKIVLFMKEISAKLNLNSLKLNEQGEKDLLYYVTMFISTYYESRRAYLNKVCERLSVEQERDLKEKSDSEASFLDVNLICIEHINYKLKKPHYDDEYLCFLGLYKAYMYSEYEILFDFLKSHNIIKD